MCNACTTSHASNSRGFLQVWAYLLVSGLLLPDYEVLHVFSTSVDRARICSLLFFCPFRPTPTPNMISTYVLNFTQWYQYCILAEISFIIINIHRTKYESSSSIFTGQIMNKLDLNKLTLCVVCVCVCVCECVCVSVSVCVCVCACTPIWTLESTKLFLSLHQMWRQQYRYWTERVHCCKGSL